MVVKKELGQELGKTTAQSIRQFAKNVCEILFRSVLILIAYLEYATSIRVFIISHYGLYWIGLADGIITAITVIATILFLYIRFSTDSLSE